MEYIIEFIISVGADDDDDDDVPDLVENFDEVSKNEANVAASRVEEEDDAAEAADDEDDEKSSPSALPAGNISIKSR